MCKMRPTLLLALASAALLLPAKQGIAGEGLSRCTEINLNAEPERAIVICSDVILQERLTREELSDAYRVRANAHMRTGRFGVAVRDFSTAVELDPGNPRNYWERGNAYIWARNPELAFVDFNMCMEIDPHYFGGHAGIAFLQNNAGYRSDAAAGLRKALALKPDEHWTRRIRAEILYKLERYDEAAAEYQIIVDAGSQAVDKLLDRRGQIQKVDIYTDALVGLARSFIQLRQFETVPDLLEQALSRDPSLESAWLALAQYWSAQNDGQKALDAAEKMLALDPHSLNAFSLKAQSLNELGRNKEALLAIDDGLRIDKSWGYSFQIRGVILRELGRYIEAAADFEQASLLSNGIRDALQQRAKVAGYYDQPVGTPFDDRLRNAIMACVQDRSC